MYFSCSKYKAPVNDKFTVEGVQAFAADFLAGKVAKHIKSEVNLLY